jgi:hypothetical protein
LQVAKGRGICCRRSEVAVEERKKGEERSVLWMELDQSLRNFERVVKLAWMLWEKKRSDHGV